MKGALYFFLGLILGAAGGAYVAKSIAEKKAEDQIEKATLEARDYYKQKFEPKKEEPKQESVFGNKDDLEANKNITRIYGHQFDLYSGEPVIEGEHTETPGKETYAYEIDPDDFGTDRDYTTYSLDYYANGFLLDETGNIVDDPIHLIGGDILDELCKSSPIAYVRNDVTKTDYEVCFIDDNYEESGGVKD